MVVIGGLFMQENSKTTRGTMNYLVTGGCGFIGSHFVELLLRRYPQARVTNLDALTYAAHPDTATHLASLAPDRYTLVKGDIAGPIVRTLLAKNEFDAIINFAAETHVDRSILDSDAF